MGAMDSLEPEVWLNEEEPIATFFLQLPDTLGWRKGLPIRELHKIDPRLRRILEGSQPVPDGVEVLGEGRPTYRNLVGANVLRSSILLHQVSIDLGVALGLDSTMEALQRGLPGIDKLAGTERPPLGGAWCTVAEVAIPLQTMAAVRAAMDLDDNFRLPGAGGVDDGLIDEAFDLAVAQVRRVQSMYHVVTRVPLTLLTPQILPPFVPYLIRTARQITSGKVVEVSFYLPESSVGHVSEPDELSAEAVEGVFRAGRRDDVLFIYLDLHREASAALHRHGNLRETVVMVAAAAEALLNIVLCFLQWEAGMTPEASAHGWPDTLMTRVKTLYARRIGGDWDPSGRGPVGRWAREVAGVRNRVVHAGYSPSREEAERSLVVVEDLLRYIGDRLVYGPNLRKYPRTASNLLDRKGFERRNRYPRWLQELQEDPSEPHWHERFGSWYAAQTRLLADAETPRVSEEQRCDVLAIFDSEDRYAWVARDPLTHQAASISVTLPDKQQDPIARFRTFREMSEGAGVPNYPISVGFERSAELLVQREGPWVEEYHLCPLLEVMADGSDFAALWPLEVGGTMPRMTRFG